MSIVYETIQLILSPPGSLVYHLLILFSLEAILGMAAGAWQRRRAGGSEENSFIFVAAATGMFLTRVVLIIVALRGSTEASFTATVIPPLERALDTALILLLAWALLPWRRHQGLSWFLPLFGLLSIALLFVFFLSSWQADLAANPMLFYSGSWQESIWSTVQLFLLILIVPAFLWRRGREWGLLLAVLMILVAGNVLQLLSPDRNIHVAGWVRLAQLVAFPLLAVAVYRRVIENLRFRAHELEEVSQESLGQIAGLIYLIESSQRMVAALNLEEVMSRAVREVVRLLKVDICGLIFPIDLVQGKATLAATYEPRNHGTTQPVKLTLTDHPGLEHAIRRKKPVTIDSITGANSQLKELYVLLGSMKTGPLLIQPLMYNSTIIGALVLGNHHSQQRFTGSQQKLCQALSHQVAIAIENARRYQAGAAELASIQAQLQKEQKKHQRVKVQLEAQIEQSQKDAAHFARRLDEAMGRAKRKHQDVERLMEQLQTTEEEQARLEAEVDRARQEISFLKEQNAKAQNIQATLESKLVLASEQIAQMAHKLQQHRGRTSLADTILDTISVGLLVTDENARVELVNPTAEKFLAQPIEQMLGQPIGEICADATWRDKINSLLGGQADLYAAETEETFSIHIKGRALAVKLGILRDENNQFTAITAMLDASTVSQEANQARDEFVGSLAQELRTPMTSITGYTDLLLSESVGIVSEMQHKFLQRIKANIERMGAMLNDLIGVTAIDSGQIHLQPEPIEVGSAIQEAVSSVRAQLEEKNISLHLDLDPEVETIEVDVEAFKQIMSNLVNNACKVSPVDGEIRIRASYEAEKRNSDRARLLISVTDSGGGIAPEDQPRVFDRFYRAGLALISGLGETGVGLSIAKALVEAHSGQIWVESEIGRGSTFAFALPASPDKNSSS